MTVAALAMDRSKGGDELIVGSESGRLYLAPALHKQAGTPRAAAAGGVAGKAAGGLATVQPVRFGFVFFGGVRLLAGGGVLAVEST